MKTYTINQVTSEIYKRTGGYSAIIVECPDNFMFECYKFELDSLRDSKFKTIKELTKKIDDFVMSLN